MGVYINMEMPSSCFDCPLEISVNFGVLCCPTHTIISDDNLFDADGRELRRQDWCPLVPVQPHGRLGDLDAIEKQINYIANLQWNKDVGASGGMFAALEVVEDAPTIIPASEEGEK